MHFFDKDIGDTLCFLLSLLNRYILNKQEILTLIDKYLAGSASAEEENLLVTMFDSFQITEEWDEKELGSKALMEAKMKKRLTAAVKKSRSKTRLQTLHPWLEIAASIVLILTIGLYLSRDYFVTKSTTVVTKMDSIKNDIVPGRDMATLTLADGSIVPLDDSAGKQILLTNGVSIQKAANGQLVYTIAEGLSAGNKPLDAIFNTLSTPKGGQYQVVLPDGSRVWLNAESSIRFPTVFVGVDREVTLSGEAYFEVAKDKSKPFKVHVEGMEVEVLGTHFNISAYGEERISTTLMEGAVKVKHGTNNILLQPGQLAHLNKRDGAIKTMPADIEATMAWKNGYFMFDNENIRSIMTKLSRWYNAEITYVGNMEGKNFSAKISKRSNISEVLEMLELTGIIHFKIEGRRVTVMN